MSERKLKITRKDDEYSTFSIRIKNEFVKKLDELASKKRRSRNEVINLCIEFSLENLDDFED